MSASFPEFLQSRRAAEGDGEAEPAQDRHRRRLQRQAVRPPKNHQLPAHRERAGEEPLFGLFIHRCISKA